MSALSIRLQDGSTVQIIRRAPTDQLRSIRERLVRLMNSADHIVAAQTIRAEDADYMKSGDAKSSAAKQRLVLREVFSDTVKLSLVGARTATRQSKPLCQFDISPADIKFWRTKDSIDLPRRTWARNAVEDISVRWQGQRRGGGHTAELHIHIRGQPVDKLLPGQLPQELDDLCDALRAELGMDSRPVLGAAWLACEQTKAASAMTDSTIPPILGTLVAPYSATPLGEVIIDYRPNGLWLCIPAAPLNDILRCATTRFTLLWLFGLLFIFGQAAIGSYRGANGGLPVILAFFVVMFGAGAFMLWTRVSVAWRSSVIELDWSNNTMTFNTRLRNRERSRSFVVANIAEVIVSQSLAIRFHGGLPTPLLEFITPAQAKTLTDILRPAMGFTAGT